MTDDSRDDVTRVVEMPKAEPAVEPTLQERYDSAPAAVKMTVETLLGAAVTRCELIPANEGNRIVVIADVEEGTGHKAFMNALQRLVGRGEVHLDRQVVETADETIPTPEVEPSGDVGGLTGAPVS